MRLEDLPVGTIIRDQDDIAWMKDTYNDGNDIWHELYPHCGDCTQGITEKGVTDASKYSLTATHNAPAHELITKFKITHFPIGTPDPFIHQAMYDQKNGYQDAPNPVIPLHPDL